MADKVEIVFEKGSFKIEKETYSDRFWYEIYHDGTLIDTIYCGSIDIENPQYEKRIKSALRKKIGNVKVQRAHSLRRIKSYESGILEENQKLQKIWQEQCRYEELLKEI
jgi:hypothetical protein